MLDFVGVFFLGADPTRQLVGALGVVLARQLGDLPHRLLDRPGVLEDHPDPHHVVVDATGHLAVGVEAGGGDDRADVKEVERRKLVPMGKIDEPENYPDHPSVAGHSAPVYGENLPPWE